MRVLLDRRTVPAAIDRFLHTLFTHAKATEPARWHLTVLGPVPSAWATLIDAQVEHPLLAVTPDIVVQPDPLVARDAVPELFFRQAHRMAFVDGGQREYDRDVLIRLKSYHAFYTLNDATTQSLRMMLGPRCVIHATTPEEVYREWSALVVPIRRPRRLALVAETACGDRVAQHTLRIVPELRRRVPLELLNTSITDSIPRLREADIALFVVTDSPAHAWVYELHRRWGGVLLLHGEFLGHLWYGRYGLAAPTNLAQRELGRSVSPNETRLWLMEPHTCSPRFFDGVAPLFVHSNAAQATFAERGQTTVCLPFSVEAGPATKPPSTTGVVLVQAEKASEIVQACELLASWNVVFRVAWVGEPPRTLLKRYGLARRVRSIGRWEDALPEASVAVVLRPQALGSGSELLQASLAAGIPCVTTQAETRLLDGPPYLLAVPDRLSPLLLAEAIRDALHVSPSLIDQQRSAYLEENTATRYAESLLRALGE